MSRSRLTLLLAFLPLAASAAFAQATMPHRSTPVEIRGQVRFAEGGAPAPNVSVRLDNFSGGFVSEAVTDRSGRFHFQNIGPGIYLVKARVPGYLEIERQVDLQRVSSEMLFFSLVKDPNFADERSPSGLVVDASVPAAARTEYEAGREAILNKKTEEGIARLEKAVQLHPKFFDAHLMLGTAYLDARQFDKSEAALLRALEIKPKTSAALFALGELYREQKKYEEAEKALKEGLAQDDRSAEGHFTLGRVYFAKNDIPSAGREVGQALKLKPDFAEAHLLAGNLYLRARRADYALAEFQEYLRLAPSGEYAAQTKQLVQKIKQAMAEKKN
ncbi:MAG TPA: tetratricopeptide repeat protein [Pyrinomonadaceae bacterium]|nr:tetratricopeptide repeat protein [Pyrinomonadaceae bacterium]